MAMTTPNLHSLSSSFSLINPSSNFSSSSSFAFQIPSKTTQFPPKRAIFLHPIHLHCSSNLGISASLHTQNSFNCNDAVSPLKKTGSGRGVLVAQATETVSPTTEQASASPSKSLKKNKKIKYPRKILDVYQILHVPIITEAAIKNIGDENSLLFTVDVRADKKMIREAVNNFFGVKVRKVNTLIRPDGTKKAYIMLSREYNASDIAKKIGIFPSSS